MKVNKDIERLFREYYLRMYHLAYSILYDKAEAKDAVSDVFTKLLLTLAKLFLQKVNWLIIS